MPNFHINIWEVVQVAWGYFGFPLFAIFASRLSSILFIHHARLLILVELIDQMLRISSCILLRAESQSDSFSSIESTFVFEYFISRVVSHCS